MTGTLAFRPISVKRDIEHRSESPRSFFLPGEGAGCRPEQICPPCGLSPLVYAERWVQGFFSHQQERKFCMNDTKLHVRAALEVRCVEFLRRKLERFDTSQLEYVRLYDRT